VRRRPATFTRTPSSTPSDDPPEGALSDNTQLVTWVFQVTCVADGPGGAQVMQRRTRTALHSFVPVVAGVTTTRIELSEGSGVTRDDAVQPPLFYTTDRFSGKTSA
jgi:hypothetical protein